jgi:molybdopterin-containing oxidoreductase family membrane subunit
MAILGVGLWCKHHPIATSVIAGVAVLSGTWMERWNIVVPTLTHPRLIRYSSYTPTLTEIIISTASVALLVLMTLVFFKLFPPVSIWEVAEGRVIESAHEKLQIPLPDPSPLTRKRRWGFR